VHMRMLCIVDMGSMRGRRRRQSREHVLGGTNDSLMHMRMLCIMDMMCRGRRLCGAKDSRYRGRVMYLWRLWDLS
jgi:hypothetical protein